MKLLQLVVLSAFLTLSHLNAQPLKAKTRAKLAILINPDTGAVLFEKKATEPWYPASTIKIATALYAIEQNQPDLSLPTVATKELITPINAQVKQADPLKYPPYILEHDGVMMGLKEGATYLLEDLLHGLLLRSGNDAANVIAHATSGCVEGFTAGVNRFLKEKGIHQTHMQNPHGLHHPAQITTAQDLASIATLAFQNPIFRKMIGTKVYETADGTFLHNTNRLFKEGKFQYPKFVGGKTGYIGKAGYNIVACAEDKGRTLIAVLLGCRSIIELYEDVISLFELAFREQLQTRKVFSKDHKGFTKAIGKKEQILHAKIEKDLDINYYLSEKPTPNAKISWADNMPPICVGDRVGELEIVDERGNLLASTPLIATVEIRREQKYWQLLAAASLLLVGFFIQKRKLFKR